jgi:hypothetical protein
VVGRGLRGVAETVTVGIGPVRIGVQQCLEAIGEAVAVGVGLSRAANTALGSAAPGMSNGSAPITPGATARPAPKPPDGTVDSPGIAAA